MRKFILSVLPVIVMSVVLVLTGCQNCIDGQGNIETQTRSIDSFSKLEVNINADIEIGVTSKNTMQIHAQKNVIDAITTKVKGDKLIIDASPCLGNTEPVQIKLFTTRLEEIEMNGSGMVKTLHPVTTGDIELELNGSGKLFADVYANKVEVELNGSGEIIVNGTTNKQKVEIEGSGNYRALGLRAFETEAKIEGSGIAHISSLNKLNIKITGSGEVIYSGNPELKTKITGSGKATKMD
jgi:predicted small secreted protein